MPRQSRFSVAVVGHRRMHSVHRFAAMQAATNIITGKPVSGLHLVLRPGFNLLVAERALERSVPLAIYDDPSTAQDRWSSREIPGVAQVRRWAGQPLLGATGDLAGGPMQADVLLAFWAGTYGGWVWDALHDWAASRKPCILMRPNHGAKAVAGSALSAALGLRQFGTIISHFAYEWAPLSMQYPCAMWWEGVEWRSAEHAYQSARAMDKAVADHIAAAHTPQEARRRGSVAATWPDWPQRRAGVLQAITEAKFRNPWLMRILLNTGAAHLAPQPNADLSDRSGFSAEIKWVEQGLGAILMRLRQAAQMVS